MSYGEYKNSGRSGGKVLYQLCKIGIPIQIVESVTFDSGKITYYKKPFGTYLWSIDDTPIFSFEGEYICYNSLEQQKVLELKDLLEERKNMKSALMFYSEQCKHLVGTFAPLTLVTDKGSIADFCLGKKIANDDDKFISSILKSYEYRL